MMPTKKELHKYNDDLAGDNTRLRILVNEMSEALRQSDTERINLQHQLTEAMAKASYDIKTQSPLDLATEAATRDYQRAQDAAFIRFSIERQNYWMELAARNHGLWTEERLKSISGTPIGIVHKVDPSDDAQFEHSENVNTTMWQYIDRANVQHIWRQDVDDEEIWHYYGMCPHPLNTLTFTRERGNNAKVQVNCFQCGTDDVYSFQFAGPETAADESKPVGRVTTPGKVSETGTDALGGLG